jgi:hypothetical protein
MAELTSAAEATANSCCAPEQQATCCEPSAKADCCGHDEGCGCATGTTAKRATDIQAPATRPIEKPRRSGAFP